MPYTIGGHPSLDQIYKLDIYDKQDQIEMDAKLEVGCRYPGVVSGFSTKEGEEYIFIAGGEVQEDYFGKTVWTPLSKCYKYDFTKDIITTLPPMNRPRAKCSMVLISDQFLYVIDGADKTQAGIERLDLNHPH